MSPIVVVVRFLLVLLLVCGYGCGLLLLVLPPALRVLVFDRATMIATMDEAMKDTLAVEI
jgi:hypothetical protein